MKRRNFSTWTLLSLVLMSTACSRPTYDVTPANGVFFQSLRIKVNVKNLETGRRGSFKVLLKYNVAGDKMFFLSPLNQVFGLLFVEGERAMLVNNKKKNYWTGEFSQLMQFMWGDQMDFRYDQFKALVVSGILPRKDLRKQGVEISVEHEADKEHPASLKMTAPDISVKIKITDRKTLQGKLSLEFDLHGLKQARLREVLE